MGEATSNEADLDELLPPAECAYIISGRGRDAESPDIAMLMSSVQRRSIRSFKTLYDLTSPRILRIILRINRNRDDADEILQDVYVQAWTRSAQFDVRRGSVMAWLTSIAQNKAVSSLRGRTCRLRSIADSSRVPRDDDELTIPSEELQPPASAARAQAVRAVREEINALPSEHRLCIVLAFFNDLTHAEIAVRVGRPIGTVKSWLRRSLHGMRPVLAAH